MRGGTKTGCLRNPSPTAFKKPFNAWAYRAYMKLRIQTTIECALCSRLWELCIVCSAFIACIACIASIACMLGTPSKVPAVVALSQIWRCASATKAEVWCSVWPKHCQDHCCQQKELVIRDCCIQRTDVLDCHWPMASGSFGSLTVDFILHRYRRLLQDKAADVIVVVLYVCHIVEQNWVFSGVFHTFATYRSQYVCC